VHVKVWIGLRSSGVQFAEHGVVSKWSEFLDTPNPSVGNICLRPGHKIINGPGQLWKAPVLVNVPYCVQHVCVVCQQVVSGVCGPFNADLTGNQSGVPG